MPPAPQNSTSSPLRGPVAGLLAFLFPGAGHLYLGYRSHAIVYGVVIGVTFWGGVAIGGVRSTVDLEQRKAWFVAQLCTGVHALAVAWPDIVASRGGADEKSDLPLAYWPAEDLAIVYTGVAGLLNLLVILDALARAEGAPSLRPVPHGREPPDKRKT